MRRWRRLRQRSRARLRWLNPGGGFGGGVLQQHLRRLGRARSWAAVPAYAIAADIGVIFRIVMPGSQFGDSSRQD